MKKEIIQLDNLKRCSGGANYIHQLLLSIREVLSVKVDIKLGHVEIYYVGEDKRDKFIHILTQKGYPEAGTANCIHKSKAFLNCAIGLII